MLSKLLPEIRTCTSHAALYSIWRVTDITTDTHAMLLNGDIGEVNKHVLHLTHTAVVLHSAETTESKAIPKTYIIILSRMTHPTA